MVRIGEKYTGLRYSDSLPPGTIFTRDQNWQEATPEQKQQNKRLAITAGEIIISAGLFIYGSLPVSAVLGLIFIGENIVRYKKLNSKTQT